MAEPLVLCSCLACRSAVWHAPGGSMAGGKPLTFDLVGRGPDRMLFVHDCEEGMDDERDYGDGFDPSEFGDDDDG